MVAEPLTMERFDSGFWHGLREDIVPKIEPLFRELFIMGVEIAMGLTPIREKAFGAGAKEILPVDYNIINSAMESMISDYTDTWWAAQEVRARNRLRESLQKHRVDGGGVDAVMDDLKGYFAPSRIESIAVTETTNLFGMGAQATYAAAGISQWQWQTVNDPKVDAVCRALNGKKFDIAVPFRAAHPRCRCFPRPVVIDEPEGNKREPIIAPTVVQNPLKGPTKLPTFDRGRLDPATAPISEKTRQMLQKYQAKPLGDAFDALYTEWGYPTNWSGRIVGVGRSGAAGVKKWECDIGISPTYNKAIPYRNHTMAHEMAHAIGGIQPEMYGTPFKRWLEEAATESYARRVVTRIAAEDITIAPPRFTSYQYAVEAMDVIAKHNGWESGEEFAVALKQHLADYRAAEKVAPKAEASIFFPASGSTPVEKLNSLRLAYTKGDISDDDWAYIRPYLSEGMGSKQLELVKARLAKTKAATKGLLWGMSEARGPARIYREIDAITAGRTERIKVLARLLGTASRREAEAYRDVVESAAMAWSMPAPEGPDLDDEQLAPIGDAWEKTFEKFFDA